MKNKMMKRFIIAMSLAFAASCSDDYDDTDLWNHVNKIEEQLTQLQADIKNLNETNTALTALLNGGVISNVQPLNKDGRTGWTITVTNSAGSKDYEIFNGNDGAPGKDGNDGAPGKDGNDGAPGKDGNDGISPQLTLGYDEDGRAYWILNGTPLTDGEGNKIYATGEKGADGKEGKDGVTPQFKAEADPATPDDENIYWWVSTDGKPMDDPAKTWQKLTPMTGDMTVSGGVGMTYNAEDNTVTFTLQDQSFTFDVMNVEFTVKDTEQNHFYNGQSRAYGYEIPDGDGYLVKVSLQNNDGSFSAAVDPDGKQITVAAMQAGAKNNVDVEVVKQNGPSRHFYFPVVADVAKVEFATTAEKHHVYYGEGIEGTVVIKGRLTSDIPGKTVTFAAIESLPAGSYELPAVTFGADETEADFELTLTRNKLAAGESYEVALGIEPVENVLSGANTCTLSIDDQPGMLTLTAANYSSPFDGSGSGEGGGPAALCDGAQNTFFGSIYWEDQAFTTYDAEIKEYGVFIDVTLPVEIKVIQFKYQQRAGANGRIQKLAVGAEADGSFDKLGEEDAENTEQAAWNTTQSYHFSDYKSFGKARFGVLVSNMGDLTADPIKSMALAELQVLVLE